MNSDFLISASLRFAKQAGTMCRSFLFLRVDDKIEVCTLACPADIAFIRRRKRFGA